MKLSHSKIELFKMCPQRYDFHYNQRIRPLTISSALFFGGMIGDSVQLMCLKKKDELTEEEKELGKSSALKYFLDQMREVQINRTTFDLPDNEFINYYLSDYDETILTGADLKRIERYKEENDFVEMNFSDLRDKYKSHSLPRTVKKLMNFMFYISCRRRGILMIRAYEKEILPRIKKVHAIERQITIGEKDGEDSIIGYIDLICDFEMDDGSIQKVLFDHKTSSVKYPAKRLTESQQLALYNYSEKIDNVGYIVMVKKIKQPKRGMRKGEIFCDVQVMIGQIEEEVTMSILEFAAQTLENIQAEKFDKKFDSCFAFGQRCQYYGICREKKGLAECRLIKLGE